MKRRSFLSLLGMVPVATSLPTITQNPALAARPQVKVPPVRSSAKVFRQEGFPISPVSGDIWIDMSMGHQVKVWSDGMWRSAADNLSKG